MSCQQCIAWWKAENRRLGHAALRELEIVIAPNEERQFYQVRDRLIEMAQGGTDG